MEDLKKRKLDEAGNGGISSSPEDLKSLLDPLSKSQLVDLLSKLYVIDFNFSIFSFGFCFSLFSFTALGADIREAKKIKSTF